VSQHPSTTAEAAPRQGYYNPFSVAAQGKSQRVHGI